MECSGEWPVVHTSLTWDIFAYICTHICTHVCVYDVFVYTCLQIQAYIHACMHTYVYVHCEIRRRRGRTIRTGASFLNRVPSHLPTIRVRARFLATHRQLDEKPQRSFFQEFRAWQGWGRGGEVQTKLIFVPVILGSQRVLIDCGSAYWARSLGAAIQEQVSTKGLSALPRTHGLNQACCSLQGA